jgi:hypothetical protein
LVAVQVVLVIVLVLDGLVVVVVVEYKLLVAVGDLAQMADNLAVVQVM